MSKRIDHTGETYGQWTVLHYYDTVPNSQARWMCQCSCGRHVPVRMPDLRNGSSTRCKSCGCRAGSTIHGETTSYYKSREFTTWMIIRQRCTDPKYKQYRFYGGRGITICARWHNSVQ